MKKSQAIDFFSSRNFLQKKIFNSVDLFLFFSEYGNITGIFRCEKVWRLLWYMYAVKTRQL